MISLDLQYLLDARKWVVEYAPEGSSYELYAKVGPARKFIRRFLTERELHAFVDGHCYALHGRVA